MHKFIVKGSSNYEVLIYKNGNNLIAKCNCQAGQNKMLCKHLSGIFQGNIENIVSNVESVKLIPEFIEDTYEGQLYLNLIADEVQLERLKENIAKAKKLLGKELQY